MKTTWKYSLEFDALKVLETAYQLRSGFYQSMGFIVKDFVPNDSQQSKKGVIFPNLNYSSYPNFWDSVMALNYHEFPIEYNKKLVNFICSELKPLALRNPEISNLKREWKLLQPRLIKKICTICRLNTKDIRTLTIHLTHFGAGASFNICDKTPFDISISLRLGGSVSNITSCLLSSLLKNRMFKNLAFNWPESSAVIDWLIYESSLAELLEKDIAPLLLNLRSASKQDKESSARYLTQLGLIPSPFEFKILKGKFLVNQKELLGLTKSERILLLKLLSNKNETVSYSELSDALMQNEDTFSLYAISKNIQRLRDKLTKNFVSPNYIQVIRGEGYKLIST